MAWVNRHEKADSEKPQPGRRDDEQGDRLYAGVSQSGRIFATYVTVRSTAEQKRVRSALNELEVPRPHFA